ncbi:PD40 domain-containing protein, partial [Nostoc sp. 2RC]|nr:PD40 domain-containing protein [Nostoc sp. 2RC]
TGHSSRVNSVVFSPDGKTLASASDDKTIKLWDVSTSKAIKTLTGHSSRVNSVVFSPDGKTLASASDDNTIKLW